MGASSSSDQKISTEQQELESLAVSTGSLLLLQKSFSNLSDPHTNSIPLQSLQECFCLTFETSSTEISPIPEYFSKLLSNLGPAIIDLFFIVDKDGVNWIEFLRGYIKCCGRMSSSMTLITLYRLYAAISSKASVPSKLEFESEDPDTTKISGYVTSTDVLMLLWMSWVMSQSSSKTSKQQDLPDINHLVLSAISSCTEVGNDVNIWECDVSGLEVQLPAQEFHMWALTTIPNLAHCFTQYMHNTLQRGPTSEELSKTSKSSSGDIRSSESHKAYLLTCGRAWSISLSLTSTLSAEILRAYAPKNGDEESENLLYRSSIHGKGMNRFWSNVEGYHGPLLVLVSASSMESSEGDPYVGRWIIGILTQEGFENKDVFYGSSGYLYAISPIFHVYSPHGREKNFVYSHLHATGYEPHPKPIGLAFGGTIGNERISIDEDFARITLRHHAVDKTYRPGALCPNQGFLPVEASVFEVEIWGLGGQKVKEMQNSLMKREQLFTEQRRKIDLKTFGNWEDSPEKMMMDMVSDPNRVRREER